MVGRICIGRREGILSRRNSIIRSVMVETSQACAVAQGMPCETQMHVEVQGEVTLKKENLVGTSLWKEKGISR